MISIILVLFKRKIEVNNISLDVIIIINIIMT